MKGKSPFTRFVLSVLFVLSINFTSFGAAISFSGASGGNWNVAANWSGGVLPTSDDDVTISGKTVNVVNGDNVVAGSVTIQNSGTSTVGTLNILSGGTLTVSSSTVTTSSLLIHGGVVNNQGTLSVSCRSGSNAATLLLGSSSGSTTKMPSTFANSGTLTLDASSGGVSATCIQFLQNDAGVQPTFTTGGTFNLTTNNVSGAFIIDCRSNDALINGSGSITAGTVGTPLIAEFVRVLGPDALLTIDQNVTLNYVGSSSAIYGIMIEGNSSGYSKLVNKGTMNLSGTITNPLHLIGQNLTAEFDNQGTINDTGAPAASSYSGLIIFQQTTCTMTNSGTINYNPTTDGAVIRAFSFNAGGSFSNSGTISVGSGTAITNAILLSDSKTTFTNTGTISIGSGSINGTAGGTGNAVFNNNANGVVNLTNTTAAATLVANTAVAFTNNGGTITTGSTTNTVTIKTGTPGAIFTSGIFSPGGDAAKGIINLTNSVTLGGTVKMNVTGITTAGTDYDQIVTAVAAADINVTGATLALTMSALTPAYGTTLDIIKSTNGTVTGTFGTVTGLPLGWSVVYSANKVSLNCILATITGAATATAFTTTYGTASATQTFAVSGVHLVTDITATAPTGFEVSNGGAYGSTTTFTNVAGNASGTLSIRMSATAGVAGSYNAQNIVLSTTNAQSVNISTAGSGNAVTAKALSIGAPTIASKVYDGSATSGTVTPGVLSGFVGSETVSVLSAIGTFADAAVGTNKPATIVYTLANGSNGGLATNYSLANGSANGDITSQLVTVTSGSQTLASLNLTVAAELTVSGTAIVTVGATQTIRSLTIESGGKVIVSNPLTVTDFVTVAANGNLDLSNTLSIGGNMTLKGNQTQIFNLKLGSSMTIGGTLKFLKTLDDTNWYFMAFPCNIALSGIKLNGSSINLGVDFFIKYYNGSTRASNGPGSNWVTITDDHLTANQGYIFGVPNGAAHNVSEITFPLDKNSINSEATPRTISVNYYGALTSVTSNLGWNLVGEPYLSKYDMQTGSNILNLYRFNGSTYDFYAQNTLNLPQINPFEAYFTQVTSGLEGSGLTFGLAGRQSAPASVATNSSDLVRLNLSTATGTDKTYLILDDNQSTAYQIGEDLEKLMTFGTAAPQVYSVLDGINYANNALPISSVQNLAVGYYSRNSGNVTMSVEPIKVSSIAKLLLTDNGTSPATITDLLSSNYSFVSTAGSNNNRFTITAQSLATDVKTMSKELDGVKISLNNDKLLIQNVIPSMSISIYDALGKLVDCRKANSNMVDFKLCERGIYVLQLKSGTTFLTRKIIY